MGGAFSRSKPEQNQERTGMLWASTHRESHCNGPCDWKGTRSRWPRIFSREVRNITESSFWGEHRDDISILQNRAKKAWRMSSEHQLVGCHRGHWKRMGPEALNATFSQEAETPGTKRWQTRGLRCVGLKWGCTKEHVGLDSMTRGQSGYY